MLVGGGSNHVCGWRDHVCGGGVEGICYAPINGPPPPPPPVWALMGRRWGFEFQLPPRGILTDQIPHILCGAVLHCSAAMLISHE